MRVIDVEFDRIVRKVCAGTDWYASWVKASEHDLPVSFLMESKPNKTLSIKIDYPNEGKTHQSGQLGNASVYHNGNLLGGFDIPMKNFKSELKDLIHRLKNEIGKLNDEGQRTNYKIIAAYLSEYADELFLPGQ